MLQSIVKATRAHYAALQHKPSADRVALDYEVMGRAETCVSRITAGTIWVKVPNEAMRKAELTKLMNRLRVMYPEARYFHAEYRDAPSKTPMLDGQRYLQENRQ